MRNALLEGLIWLVGCCAMVSMAAVAQDSAPAKQPAWFATPYPYVLVDQDLRAAFSEFGHHLGVMLVLSDKVRGRSRSNLRAITAGEFLGLISEANHLSWYVDGDVLYVNAEDEASIRVFTRATVNLDQLQAWLNSLQVYGKPLSIRGSADGNELSVFGPAPFLVRVQQHVDQVPKPMAAVSVHRASMRIFRGSSVSEINP